MTTRQFTKLAVIFAPTSVAWKSSSLGSLWSNRSCFALDSTGAAQAVTVDTVAYCGAHQVLVAADDNGEKMLFPMSSGVDASYNMPNIMPFVESVATATGIPIANNTQGEEWGISSDTFANSIVNARFHASGGTLTGAIGLNGTVALPAKLTASLHSFTYNDVETYYYCVNNQVSSVGNLVVPMGSAGGMGVATASNNNTLFSTYTVFTPVLLNEAVTLKQFLAAAGVASETAYHALATANAAKATADGNANDIASLQTATAAISAMLALDGAVTLAIASAQLKADRADQLARDNAARLDVVENLVDDNGSDYLPAP